MNYAFEAPLPSAMFLNCTVLRETSKAWLIEFDSGQCAWIPRSHMLAWHSQSGDITVTRWIANIKMLRGEFDPR